MNKAFIFGAGNTGMSVYNQVKERYDILGFVDNNPRLVGRTIEGLTVYSVTESLMFSDVIYIVASYPGLRPIEAQLLSLEISPSLIVTEYIRTQVEARILFLNNIGEMFHQRAIGGQLAEGGVFQGDFAKEINRVFPDKKLYLFDTFAGFDKRDLNLELSRGFSNSEEGHLGITHEDSVIKGLPHPDMAIIKKGFFPETTLGIDDIFCFVNLDFDLYQPTLEGLRYFYPRMVSGGVIIIHDYFSEGYRGVSGAVDEFVSSLGITFLPIGDGISVCITKP